jgi:multicomponent Na+:H+ antiporter subunit G
MTEILAAVLLLVGSFFIFVASLGIVRMPDLFMRMSCSTKAGTAGIGALLFAVAVYFGELGVGSRALATFGFIFLTAPIGSHRIGRIAYLIGVPLWRRTVKDEMKDIYPSDACEPFGEECLIPSKADRSVE